MSSTSFQIPEAVWVIICLRSRRLRRTIRQNGTLWTAGGRYCTIDLRSTPTHSRELMLSPSCSIYLLSIGDCIYLGSTKTPTSGLYYHHQKIYGRLFKNEIWETYINIERAVAEFVFIMQFRVIKSVEYRWDLAKEEQLYQNELSNYLKLLNACMYAYRKDD